MYAVMTNDTPHAAFTNEAIADAYAKAGNEYDKRKNPHRVVFYNVHHLELNHHPPFFGETPDEATARTAEWSKALDDQSTHGTGIVHKSKDGSIRHVPIGSDEAAEALGRKK